MGMREEHRFHRNMLTLPAGHTVHLRIAGPQGPGDLAAQSGDAPFRAGHKRKKRARMAYVPGPGARAAVQIPPEMPLQKLAGN